MRHDQFIYPIDIFKKRFGNFTGNERLLLDDRGVIVRRKDQFARLFRLDKKSLENTGTGEYFHHPCPIAQGAIGYYDLWLENGDSAHLEQFRKQVNWLEENGVRHGDALLYPFPFPIPAFSSDKDWVSGMYQGHILSAFVRAAELLKKGSYADMANKVYSSFAIPLGEPYGFRNEDKFGLWFEEAPIMPPNHILNGYIFAIWGIRDFYIHSGADDVRDVWNKCVKTLVNALPEYDSGFWSYYNMEKKIASYNYHRNVHIPQLRAMYRLTGQENFRKTAGRWEKYSASWHCRIRKKMAQTFPFARNIRKNAFRV